MEFETRCICRLVASVSAGDFSGFLLVSASEAFFVCALEFVGNAGAAIFFAVIHVQPAVVAEVFSRACHAILKSAMLRLVGDFAASAFWRMDGPIGFTHVFIAAAHEMIHGSFVTPAKAFAVCFAKFVGKSRMAVFFAIVHVGTPVVADIFASSFNTILKATALDLFPFTRSGIPCAAVISILKISRTFSLGHTGCSDGSRSCGSEKKGK
jgi:hypothetical protein